MRSDAIKGWKPAKVCSPCRRPEQEPHQNDQSLTTSIEGRVIEDVSRGSWCREVHLQNENDVIYRVILDAEAHEAIKPWMAIKGTRQLLCVGASVRISVAEDASREDAIIVAEDITLTAALPATSYLSRLLVIPIDTLRLLFNNSSAEETESDLASALHPLAISQVRSLRQLCAHEKKAGRYHLLFKRTELMEATDAIRDFQGWSRGPNKAPKTSVQTWLALERLEKQYPPVHSESQGEEASDFESAEGGRLEFNGINVDPSLNLPNPNDERRQIYIDQRKRPQVRWMLRRIINLVLQGDRDTANSLKPRTLVDVGGGRGDLANAVAAYFSQPEIQKTCRVKVLVLDVNQSSLDAGRKRASEAKLTSSMHFALCDLADQEQISELLQNHAVDLVFGLHCCGGLAEAAVELALQSSASFFISTCCFRSNEHLATLSQLATAAAAAAAGCQSIDQFESDRDMVTALAVIGGASGQERAIRALNSLRLGAAEERFSELHGRESGKRKELRTWQESFPVEYSEQNSIMVGVIEAPW